MIPVSYIDYQKCHEYARTMGGICHIPRCEWDDLGSDAFLLAIKRSHRAGNCKNVEAAANRLMYTSVLNVINRRNTKANKMIREADEISSVFFDTSGDEIKVRVKYNYDYLGGADWKFVEQTPATQAETADDWQNPLWLRLFENERRQLRREKKKLELRIIKAGLKDSRLSVVCDSMRISWRQFRTILNFFQKRFSLCFQALRAWRAEN